MKPITELNIRLSSGKYADLLSFKEEFVDLKSIERSLNCVHRFTGHYRDKKPLTVAQHSKLVVRLAQMLFPTRLDIHFDCLIHDFAESVTGDVSSPTKQILGAAFKEYEEYIEEVFYSKLWIINTPFSEEIYNSRKVCDLLSLDIERRSMWADKTPKSKWPNIPMEDSVSLSDKRNLFDWAQAEDYVPLEKMYYEIATECGTKTKIPTYIVGE